MAALDVTFDLPTHIAAGLLDQTLVRNGGVIQDQAGQVVMWLKETGVTPELAQSVATGLSGVDPTGVLRLGVNLANTATTQQRLGAMTGQLTAIASTLEQAQGLAVIATASSLLTLGMTALGFTVLYQKVNQLEGQLQQVQASLEQLDRKLDRKFGLSFYANFRAALDLANNAFSMTDVQNRQASAHQAINRFLEAEHVYTDCVTQELQHKSQVSDEYLLTLCLAYLAECRCYLELGEYETAIARFDVVKTNVKAHFEYYVNLLLTDNPVMYLHPEFQAEIDLSRLTRIYQWQEPELTENTVFERIRDGLQPDQWDLKVWVNHYQRQQWHSRFPKRGVFAVARRITIWPLNGFRSSSPRWKLWWKPISALRPMNTKSVCSKA